MPSTFAAARRAITVAVFFCPALAVALEPGTVVLNDARSAFRVDPAVEILNDPGGRLSLESVLAGPAREAFRPNGQGAVNHGFTTDAYWYRLRLRNESRTSEWVVELDYPPLDAIDLHVAVEGGATQFIATGDQRATPAALLSHHSYAVPLRLPPGGSAVLHLRVQTEGSHQVPLVIWTAYAFLAKASLENLGFGLFFGVLLVMVAYNLFLLLFVRDAAYFYYIATLLGFMLMQLNLTGFMRQYGQSLLGDALFLHNLAVPVLVSVTLIAALQFARSFLQTAAHVPRVDRGIMWLIGFLVACLALSLVVPYSMSVPAAAALGAATSLAFIIAGVATLRAGSRTARLFLIAWTVLIFGILVKILELFGALPTSFFTAYSWQLGVVVTVTLLAVALADRINVERQERLNAQGEALAAREQAIATLQRYGRIVENVLEGVFEIDFQGRVVSANAALAQMLGYRDPQEMISGVQDLRRDHLASMEDDTAVMKLLRERGHFSGREVRVRRRDGSEFWAALSMRVIRGEGGRVTGFDGIAADISERLEKEKLARERAMAQAAADAKSSFLARMSHELRTPMNAIIGFTDLALRTSSDERRLMHLRHIESASDTLLQIINDILDISKIEAGKLSLDARPFELQLILDRVAELVSPAATAKGLELVVRCDRAAPAVLIGDALRLQQVLMNLTSNAVKFTEAGEVELRVDRQGEHEGRAQLRFEVKDTGIGLTEAQRARLFTPFSQAEASTTRRYGGTGLGLAICKQLVELMGGTIGVDSTPGMGSRFFVDLSFPVVAAAPSARPQRPAEDLRILVVDDNAAARGMYEEMLLALRMQPTVLASASEALTLLERKSCDLLLIDWKMPGMDGMEAVRRLRQDPRWQRLPVVLMTAHGHPGLAEAAAEAGADRCLDKPVKPSLLLETVLELCGFGAAVRPARRPGLDDTQHARRLEGARVLLVEDNALNRRLASEILEEAGVILDQAETGVEAVAAVQQGRYDAVLMDVQMPVMDGFEATRRIRAAEEDHRLPIIAMTANAMSQDREEALAMGMDDFVPKPINAEQLLAVLAKWIGREETMQETGETRGPRQWPQALPGIDIAGTLARIGGRGELLLSLLQDFVREHEGLVQAVRDPLAGGNREAAVRAAHTVKGAAANLGCQRLMQAAAATESALRTGRDDIEGLLAEMQAAYQELRNSVALLPQPLTAADDAPGASRSVLQAELDELAILVQRQDFKARAKVEALRPRLQAQFGEADMRALADAVNAFDFAAATLLLKRMIDAQAAAGGRAA